MTELQWLIKMLTQHKLPGALKDLFIERIGEVEAQLSRPATKFDPRDIRAPIQAASTQRILDGMNAVAPHVEPRITVPQEIVTSKGNGTSTRGPRKF